ncbi:hypothetical protein U1Q18_023857 [Sarracenia purpurea var. burkii]
MGRIEGRQMDQGEVLAEALKIMLCDDRQHDMQRAAAFIKRLATFSLCFGSAESMAASVSVKHLLQKNVKCRNLLENDAGGGSVSGPIAFITSTYATITASTIDNLNPRAAKDFCGLISRPMPPQEQYEGRYAMGFPFMQPWVNSGMQADVIISNHIVIVEAEISELDSEARIKSLNWEISELNSEAEISELDSEARIKSLNWEISELNSEAEISELDSEARMKSLNWEISELDSEARIKSLNWEISELNSETEISELDSEARIKSLNWIARPKSLNWIARLTNLPILRARAMTISDQGNELRYITGCRIELAKFNF